MYVNGALSSWVHVIRGISHGTVLRPVLYVLYIDAIDNEVYLFADDTKIFSEVSLVTDSCQPTERS